MSRNSLCYSTGIKMDKHLDLQWVEILCVTQPNLYSLLSIYLQWVEILCVTQLTITKVQYPIYNE